MTLKNHLVNEFEKRVFEESYSRIYKCLTLLDDKKIWESPNEVIAPVGCLILHLCGNARQWILSGLCGEEDNRERDQEFTVHSNIRKSDFVFLLENMKVQIKRCFDELSETDLNKKIVIQGFEVTGFSAIVHVLEHFSYHTGQITTLTKFYMNQQTGYYQDVDLNQRNRKN